MILVQAVEILEDYCLRANGCGRTDTHENKHTFGDVEKLLPNCREGDVAESEDERPERHLNLGKTELTGFALNNRDVEDHDD